MMDNLLQSPEMRDVPDVDATVKQPAPEARSLFALVRPEAGDHAELLRHRFLCRSGGLLICGPTGVGKSSLAMQAMILWGVGKPCFGIEPVRPLKSLLIQAENDDGDLAEFRDGICAGLNLTDAEIELAQENVIVVREDVRRSDRFFLEVVQPLLETIKPDLLWIDPALAYIGCDTASQRDVGTFLRHHLNPLLHQYDCAAVVVHHTNKPPTGTEKSNWQAGDFAYMGSGSAEWANWPRAVLTLRSIGSHDVFELRAAKRGGRLGWKDADGQTAYSKFIGHDKKAGVICWRDVNPDDVPKGGRPKGYDVDELFALLPPEGLSMGEWVKLAKDEYGVSEATLQRERRALLKAGRIIKSKISGKWQPVGKL